MTCFILVNLFRGTIDIITDEREENVLLMNNLLSPDDEPMNHNHV